MNQKKCPQCKNLVSVTAPTCLFCGRPNKFVTNTYVKRKWDKEKKKYEINLFEILTSKNILFISLVVVTIILIFTYK